MAKKKVLSADRQFELRQILQMATLDALVSSRRWEPGDLIFQGGTSLHLAHGSPRFSEDLDFMIRSTIPPRTISTGVQQRLANAHWLPDELSVSVSSGKTENNPYAFDVVLGAPNIIGSVRVKVELFATPETAMDALNVRVMQMRSATSAAQQAVPMVHLQTLEEGEIYADKVFAVGGRPYVKARDMFDLYWLQEQQKQRAEPPYTFTLEQLKQRLAIYSGQDPELWLKNAISRRDALPSLKAKLENDLAQWLPPMFRLPTDVLIKASVAALNEGIAVMRRHLGLPQPQAQNKLADDESAEDEAGDAPKC